MAYGGAAVDEAAGGCHLQVGELRKVLVLDAGGAKVDGVEREVELAHAGVGLWVGGAHDAFVTHLEHGRLVRGAILGQHGRQQRAVGVGAPAAARLGRLIRKRKEALAREGDDCARRERAARRVNRREVGRLLVVGEHVPRVCKVDAVEGDTQRDACHAAHVAARGGGADDAPTIDASRCGDGVPWHLPPAARGELGLDAEGVEATAEEGHGRAALVDAARRVQARCAAVVEAVAAVREVVGRARPRKDRRLLIVAEAHARVSKVDGVEGDVQADLADARRGGRGAHDQVLFDA